MYGLKDLSWTDGEHNLRLTGASYLQRGIIKVLNVSRRAVRPVIPRSKEQKTLFQPDEDCGFVGKLGTQWIVLSRALTSGLSEDWGRILEES